jgi:phage terminase large subunit
MKVRYPRRYKIEGEGEWGVSEGLVFDNWKIEDFDIKDQQLPLWIGLDFGWQDPTAISIMRVDDTNKILYFCDEFYKSQQTLEDVAAWIKHNGYHKSVIMCDSAEPRSIVELGKLGILHCKPAKKGAGSIMEGIRKLQEYQIIIKPTCENAIIEFSNYSFDKDKFDNWTDKPIDAYCHLIDAARYGVQCATNRRPLQTMDKTKLGF